jgi:hypothetical protein
VQGRRDALAAGGDGEVDDGVEEALVARTASGSVTTKCEAILEPVMRATDLGFCVRA